ncbi:MAG: hypothetical protein NBKEAIPA_00890 [Nitrospirae bacterium]|nr:MAG: hypothetical protein UZ03_NOB001001067 [Nitrospira sp. OLB3]MBV6469008.1 hypothetical protein [Nitrospirota bacterium]MCE7966386.1 hypothetical protein [Nitrospira sp. NTP2]MEB2338158.1 hypothetical protein [Nitrospirales bacterium]QOJ35289.1 MAG: hypothetical protein HRU82_10175 [Nitrospira sp.]
MAIKKGDILDERKRFPDSCGLVIKIAGGGEGFQQVRCCGHILTEEDVVPDVLPSRGRKKGAFMPGAMLEEKRQFPNSCGLRLIVLDGGAGLEGVDCCGHTITAEAVNDLRFGRRRDEAPLPTGPAGHA